MRDLAEGRKNSRFCLKMTTSYFVNSLPLSLNRVNNFISEQVYITKKRERMVYISQKKKNNVSFSYLFFLVYVEFSTK